MLPRGKPSLISRRCWRGSNSHEITSHGEVKPRASWKRSVSLTYAEWATRMPPWVQGHTHLKQRISKHMTAGILATLSLRTRRPRSPGMTRVLKEKLLSPQNTSMRSFSRAAPFVHRLFGLPRLGESGRAVLLADLGLGEESKILSRHGVDKLHFHRAFAHAHGLAGGDIARRAKRQRGPRRSAHWTPGCWRRRRSRPPAR